MILNLGTCLWVAYFIMDTIHAPSCNGCFISRCYYRKFSLLLLIFICFSIADVFSFICLYFYLFQTIEALSSVPSLELAFWLYLQCAEVCRLYVMTDCLLISTIYISVHLFFYFLFRLLMIVIWNLLHMSFLLKLLFFMKKKMQ